MSTRRRLGLVVGASHRTGVRAGVRQFQIGHFVPTICRAGREHTNDGQPPMIAKSCHLSAKTGNNLTA